MPDWFNDSLHNGEQISLEIMAVRIGLALLLGFVVAGIYFVSRDHTENETPALSTTLVLLSVLIAMVTLVIGNSVARAFGLVGALSMVRFRTVVRDTRDTAFVIFAVVVGMASGAGYAILTAIGIPAVAITALLMRDWRPAAGGASSAATLIVRVALQNDPENFLTPFFQKYLNYFRLIGTATAKEEAIDLTYAVRVRHTADAIAMVTELNRIEGIQSVDLQAQ